MNDLQAQALALQVLPLLTDTERQYVRLVSRHESGYGTGWQSPEGKASHNWGAVTVAVPAGAERPSVPAFQNADTNRAHQPIVAWFRSYPDDAAGLRDVAHEALRHPGVRESLPDAKAAIDAMGRGGYFVAPVADYVTAMRRNYVDMIAATHEAPLLNFDSAFAPGASAAASGSGGLLLGGVALLGLFTWWWERR